MHGMRAQDERAEYTGTRTDGIQGYAGGLPLVQRSVREIKEESNEQV